MKTVCRVRRSCISFSSKTYLSTHEFDSFIFLNCLLLRVLYAIAGMSGFVYVTLMKFIYVKKKGLKEVW